ncbi:unnamed protein product [marine sediment metagenome]|uniref:Uncharacterized protein n=1 Tax=marine sediment metagenome TaxID=412755 RepID=X0W6M5_9ZZZZ
MSVTSTVTLPAQPADGLMRNTPLGGNGYRSPFNQVYCRVNLAGDATGGDVEINIILDDVYLSLVNVMQAWVSGATADVPCRMQLIKDGPEFFQYQGEIPHSAAGSGSAFLNNRVWSPPPLLLNHSQAGNVHLLCPNTDGDQFTLGVWLYQFNKRAADFTELEQILDTLSRGTTIS